MIDVPSPTKIHLADEMATIRFAEDVAMALAPGDVIALQGDLGAGKSTFARALIRTLAGEENLEVPSPTFTLVQTYDTAPCAIAHLDLYRIGDPEDLTEIGFDELADEFALLIEWPEHAGGYIGDDALWITFETGREIHQRDVTISGGAPALQARLSRSRVIRDFLQKSGHPIAARRHLQGDASTRRYERIASNGVPLILMDAPYAREIAVETGTVPYHQQAGLAQSLEAFMAVGGYLRHIGISAPEIFATDTSNEFLLLEDLGGLGIIEDGKPVAARYLAAVDMLADLHAQKLPATLSLPDGGTYMPGPFSSAIVQVELNLYPDWYVPHVTGRQAEEAAKTEFTALWQQVIDQIDTSQTVLILRDIHSPNLLWQPDRSGNARVGVIDFQDALLGSPAYDVASLAQDARIGLSAEFEQQVFDHYIARRADDLPDFDTDGFKRDYAIYCAQRATKILGIFARLNTRDGKPVYLQHIPHIRTYLKRALAQPVLKDLRRWYEVHTDI